MECPDTPACAKGCVCTQEDRLYGVAFRSGLWPMGLRPVRRVQLNKAGMPLFAPLFEEKYPINRTQTARVQLAACKDTSKRADYYFLRLPPRTNSSSSS